MQRTNKSFLLPITALCAITALALIPSCGELEPVSPDRSARGKADSAHAQAIGDCRAAYDAALATPVDVTSEEGFDHVMAALVRHGRCLYTANDEVIHEIKATERMIVLNERAAEICREVVENVIEAQQWPVDAEGELISDAHDARAQALNAGCFAVLHDAVSRLISIYHQRNEDVAFAYAYEGDATDLREHEQLYEATADAWVLCELIAPSDLRQCKDRGIEVLIALATRPLQFLPPWARAQYASVQDDGDDEVIVTEPVACPRCITEWTGTSCHCHSAAGFGQGLKIDPLCCGIDPDPEPVACPRCPTTWDADNQVCNCSNGPVPAICCGIEIDPVAVENEQ